MSQEEAFMEKGFQMRTSSSNIMELDGLAWLILAQTAMDPSSLSVWQNLPG